MNRFFWVLLASCLLFCIAARAQEPKTETQGITQIVVQRTQCYGTCPIDLLTLNSDGTATYSGFENAPRRGSFKGTMEREKFMALSSFLESQNYFELKPQIDDLSTDIPALVVSVTRNRLPYCLALRLGGNRALQERMEKALLVGNEIEWTRNEGANDSGVEGTLKRQLTNHEAHLFADRPEIKDLRMAYALVELKSLDHPDVKMETRSDQEGHFQFFAAPGRYSVTARDANNLEEYRVEAPHYDYPSQTLEVKAKTFARAELLFKDINVQER